MRKSALIGAAAAAAIALTAVARLDARELTLELEFQRINRIASNQLAVWIEDSSGGHVRTLFVTDFTARKEGYRRRPAALPLWVRAFDPAARSRSEVDAVSRATPRSGRIRVVWDGTDEKGRKVAPGSYRLHIEGNIFWESMVYYSIPVDIGQAPFSFEASPASESSDASVDIPLIRDVRVSYRP